jgi:hypothetical protein
MNEVDKGRAPVVDEAALLEGTIYDEAYQGPLVAVTDEQIVLDVPHDNAPIDETDTHEIKQSIISCKQLAEYVLPAGPLTFDEHFELVNKFKAFGGEGHAQIVLSEKRVKPSQELIDEGVRLRCTRWLMPDTYDVLKAFSEDRAETEQPVYQATAISTDVQICEKHKDANNPPELSALLAMALEMKKLGPDERGFFSKLIPDGQDEVDLWCREIGKFHSGDFGWALCVCLHRDGIIEVDSYANTKSVGLGGVTPSSKSVTLRRGGD